MFNIEIEEEESTQMITKSEREIERKIKDSMHKEENKESWGSVYAYN